VTTYCHSANHTKCPYFKKFVSSPQVSANTNGVFLNQRRAKRIFKYLDFQFSQIKKDNFLQRLQYEESWISDINGYGVSFISQKYINPKTNLRFLIEENAVVPASDGIGKVVWCKILSDTPYFQIGMEFSMLFS